MQNILFLVRTFFTQGDRSQTFIGAKWIGWLLRACPARWQHGLALRVLAWSPHYFYRDINEEYQSISYSDFLQREFRRNQKSRQKIRDQILKPFLSDRLTALDYGCGPGFLAAAVAEKVAKVTAVDVSLGVIECARVINSAENLQYLQTGELSTIEDGCIDLAYSFAVIQHVTDVIFRLILSNAHRTLKPGGKLVLHVVLEEDGWKAQSDWEADSSLKGKIKLEYGLNCFSRSKHQVLNLVGEAGYSDMDITPISKLCTDDFDDICTQHLLTAHTV
jgi:SAM-dependent methyltransferase